MKSRYKLIIKGIALLGIVGLLTSCGGGGSGSGGGGETLNGSWGGTIEDPAGFLGVITLTISGSNINGTTPAGPFSGTITLNQGRIWDFLLSDGTEGGFMHDPSFTHAVFLDEFFNFGVIQKGATGGTSNYTGPEVVGSWAGDFVTVDSFFNLATTGTASAVVLNDTTFSGSSSAPDTFTGAIPTFSSTFGRWTGNISSATSGAGSIAVFLTNDMNFAGSWACFGGFALDDCAFNMWNRQ